MEANLEQLGPLEWRLTVPVDRAALEARVEEQLEAKRRRARIPGFRPGRAPMKVMQRVFGRQMLEDLWHRTVLTAVRRELDERGLWPVEAPEIESVDEGRVARARFELFPEVPAIDFQRLKIRRPVVEILDSDVENFIRGTRGPRRVGDLVERHGPEVRAMLTEELEDRVRHELDLALRDALLQAHPDLADLVAAQLEELEEVSQNPPELWEKEARELVTLGLLGAQAARQLDIRLGPGELQQEIERLATKADPSHVQEELENTWSDDEAIHKIWSFLMHRKVVVAILEQAQMEDVPMSFSELVASQQPGAGFDGDLGDVFDEEEDFEEEDDLAEDDDFDEDDE